MATELFHLSVITPEAKVFEGEAEFVAIPAHDGEIGILHDRAPLLCMLGAGKLKIRTLAGEQIWFIDGGFAQVLDNRVTVLTQRAVKPADLSAEQARRQLEDAMKLRPQTDSAAKRKAHLEASARAQLRLARAG